MTSSRSRFLYAVAAEADSNGVAVDGGVVVGHLMLLLLVVVAKDLMTTTLTTRWMMWMRRMK